MQFKYTRQGAGTVLVLQHGFLSGAAYWQAQVDCFAEYFDVIAPTLPGFGEHAFTATDNPQPIDRIEGYADYLARCHLLGHYHGRNDCPTNGVGLWRQNR